MVVLVLMMMMMMVVLMMMMMIISAAATTTILERIPPLSGTVWSPHPHPLQWDSRVYHHSLLKTLLEVVGQVMVLSEK